MTYEEARRAAARSRAAQGLPPTITDAETLDRVAAMVADAITPGPEVMANAS